MKINTSFSAFKKKHQNNKIFLDLPKNRTKPPNNKYSMDELKPILDSSPNIKYFAISNVDSAEDLSKFLGYVSDNIVVVPKIESLLGINNIEEISKLLGQEKIIMLDHDDLYSSMLQSNDDPDNFQSYIRTLIEFCNSNNITLLRTVGVMFADTENRVSEYVESSGLMIITKTFSSINAKGPCLSSPPGIPSA